MKKISYELDIETNKSAKNVKQLTNDISGLVDEINELNETNQIQKEQLLELEQRYRSLPKSAMQARKAIQDDMDMLNVAIKENNTALKGFRIDKQHKQKLISDLKHVEETFGHNTEQVLEFGEAIGETAGAMILLGGGSEETTHKLEKGIGVAMAFKGAIGGIKSGIALYNNVIKTNSLFIKANNVVTKVASFTMGLFSKSVNTTSIAFRGLKTAIAATGIGLLVIAIGELVSYFMQAEEEADNFDQTLEQLNKRYEQQIKVIDNLRKSQAQRLQQTSREMDLLNKQFDLEVAIARKRGASEKELETIENNRNVAKRKQLDAAVLLQQQVLDAAEDQRKISLTTFNAEKAMFQIRNDFGTKAYDQAAQALEVLEKQKIETKKVKDEEKNRYLDLKNALNIFDIDLKIKEQSIKKIKQQKQATTGLIAEQEKLLKQAEKLPENTESEIRSKNRKIAAINKKISRLKALGLEQEEYIKLQARGYDTEIKNTQNKYSWLSNISKDYYNKVAQQRQQDFQNEVAIMNAKHQLQSQFVNAASSALGSIAQIAGEGTKVAKAAALADIIMKTGVGFVQGLDIAQKSAAGTGPAAAFAFPIFYATQIAAVLAAVAQAKNILTKVKEGPPPNLPTSGGGGGGTAPSQPPAFNIVGQSGFNQIAGALGQQQPVQAYVVAGDITTAQQLDNNIITTATF